MNGSKVMSKIEKKYISKLLNKGKRIDGRDIFDFRDITIETNFVPKAEGSANLTLGKSRVMTGIKYDVGRPFSDTSDQGVATCMTEFVSLASPMFEKGPPSMQAVEVARVVDRGIRHGDCIQYKKLCIKEGEFCYIIFIDMYIMDYHGNLIDAAALSAITALVSTKLPTAKINDAGKVEWAGGYMPIPMIQLPVSITFGKLDDIVFLDPMLSEELVMDGRISFAINEKGQISSIQKGGIANWGVDEVIKLSRIAVDKANELRTKLNLRQYVPKI